MKYFPYLCSVENKTIVIMEKGHKATILTTNEQLYADSIANLKEYFKEYRNNKRLSYLMVELKRLSRKTKRIYN